MALTYEDAERMKLAKCDIPQFEKLFRKLQKEWHRPQLATRFEKRGERELCTLEIIVTVGFKMRPRGVESDLTSSDWKHLGQGHIVLTMACLHLGAERIVKLMKRLAADPPEFVEDAQPRPIQPHENVRGITMD